MKYPKKLLSSLKYIIIIYIIQYLTIFLSSLIYTLLGYKDLTNFVSHEASIILTIVNLIIIIILIKKHNIKTPKVPKHTYFPLIYLGISIACLLNMLIFLIIKPTPQNTTIFLYLSIISSGIIGPILEEIIFRYLLLKDLNKLNQEKKSLIIATIIFALVHLNPIKIIYAFILGLILNSIYVKSNNLKTSIIIHISANIISIFLTNFNIHILILSILGLLISMKLLSKTKLIPYK